jgi:heme o synthase
MVVADRGIPSLWLIAATVLGGTAAAGGANAINMVLDRDIDRLMERTKGRPLVTGELMPAEALAFALGLEVAAFAWLWAAVNLLSAVLAVGATAFYVFVYTLWLKRRSEQNIVIGGAAGAVPVLIGWSAVTGTVTWPPLVLFALIFVWTPPHFWALAINYRGDYAAASIPMLPTTREPRAVAVRILAYAVAVTAVSVVFSAAAGMGPLYLGSAVVLGGVFTWLAARMLSDHSPKAAMRLFRWSITYIVVLFWVMAVDQILRTGA